MTDINENSPIFIVGAPRSGTTLLTSYLASCNKIVSGPETQFFNKIGSQAFSLISDASQEQWPFKAYDLLSTLTLSGQNVLELFDKNKQDIISFLKNKPPSVGAMLESIVVPNGFDSGSQRWLEKTPNHINHIHDIFECFPSAQVILIHRDFRDSASSISKLPWASKSAVYNATLIKEWFDDLYKFDDDRIYKICYEDLVKNPDFELKKLFVFLNEEYSSDILSRDNAKSVTTDHEPWKKDVYQKVDGSNISKWEKNLSTDTARQVESILSNQLDFFGYERKNDELYDAVCIKKMKGQKLDGLDAFSSSLNDNNIFISRKDSRNKVILVEKGFKLRIFTYLVKSKLTDKSSYILLGERNRFIGLLGRYL